MRCNSCVISWENKTKTPKNKPFINKYKLEGIYFPSEKNDWKTLEKNNVTIIVNALYT